MFWTNRLLLEQYTIQEYPRKLELSPVFDNSNIQIGKERIIFDFLNVYTKNIHKYSQATFKLDYRNILKHTN